MKEATGAAREVNAVMADIGLIVLLTISALMSVALVAWMLIRIFGCMSMDATEDMIKRGAMTMRACRTSRLSSLSLGDR